VQSPYWIIFLSAGSLTSLFTNNFKKTQQTSALQPQHILFSGAESIQLIEKESYFPAHHLTIGVQLSCSYES